MTTLIFVLTWVVLGLGLLLIALSGGPSGALQRMQSQSRGSRKAATVLFVIALLVLGVGVPLAVISSVEARDDIPEANVSNLTAAEKHGRELFGQRCSQCHTLAASKAVVECALEWTDAEAWEKQNEFIGPVFTSNDAREGATAFAEKRDPVWTGT